MSNIMNFKTLLVVVFGIILSSLAIQSPHQSSMFEDAELSVGWTPFNEGHKPGFFKDYLGLVRIRGTVQKSSSTSFPSVLFKLPEGLRPESSIELFVPTFDPSEAAEVKTTSGLLRVTPSGEVEVLSGLSYFGLDGLVFKPAEQKVSRKTSNQYYTQVKAVVSSSSGDAEECPHFSSLPVVSWKQQSSSLGFCRAKNGEGDSIIHFRGSLTPRTSNSITENIALVLSNARANVNLRICAASSAGPVRLDFAATGQILVKGYRGGAIFLDGISFLSDQLEDWRAIPSWKNGFQTSYASWFKIPSSPMTGYTHPGFKKDSMGWVHLKGLVQPPLPLPKSGTMFVLPRDYRPSRKVVRCAATRSGAITITIDTDGQVSTSNVFGSNKLEWFSLDGINFPSAQVSSSPVSSSGLFSSSQGVFTSVEGFVSTHQVDTTPLSVVLPSTSTAWINDNFATATWRDDELTVEDLVRPNPSEASGWRPLQFNEEEMTSSLSQTRNFPSFRFDHNNNLVFLKGLFPIPASGKSSVQLPFWIIVEKEVYLRNQDNEPLVVNTDGEITYLGSYSHGLISLDGLHFSATADSPPPPKTIEL